MWQTLSGRGTVAIALGILVSLGFLVTAFIIFIRDGDWPAKYVSAGVTILAVMFIAIRRRASHRL